GLGYNVVPPPYTGNFMPPKPDLSFSGLEEFVNDPIVPTVKKPVVETSEAKASADKPKVKMYCLVVTDDYSRFTWVFFLSTENEISGILKSFITGIENLADHKAEAVNIAWYVQNKVLVVKPHNKTLYELFHGRTPALSFIKPFGCPVTILNTLDHLGKFDGKPDEGFFIGYLMNSKAFRVFASRKRIVEENLHIRFSENTPNIVGSGPDWLFDIDALTKKMNYEPIAIGTQSIGFASQARKEKTLSNITSCYHYRLLIHHFLKIQRVLKMVNYNLQVIMERRTNRVNVVSENISNELPFDPEMPELEDISTFNFLSDHEDVGKEADMNKLDTTIQVSPIPTTRIHKDHPLDHVIGDLHLITQTRNMSKNLKEHGNKARLVAQGHTQEERIDYDEVFAPVVRIEAIRLFLVYASFKDFMVYQMDVKSDFLYGKIEEKAHVCQLPRFEDPDFPDKVYKVKKALYGLHQAPRAWDTPLFPTMMVQAQEDICEGLENPIDPRHTPIITQPSTSQPQRLRKTKRKDTELPQTSVPTSVAKKAVNGENDDSLGRDATIATSLDAEQDRGNISKTQSKATPNEPGSKRTSLGGGSRCQEAMGDTTRVLDLETSKTTQALEIDSLKRRVKKLKRRKRSRTHGLKRLYKVGLSAKVESSKDEGLGEEDASKQGRIAYIDVNEDIALVSTHDEQMFDVDQDLDGMSTHNRIYVTPSHTKKIFGNMRRVEKGFSSRETPLFPTMVVHNQEEMGEGSANPTDPYHTPTIIQPSTSQPQKTQKHRNPRRKDTKLPQPSDLTEYRADETVNEEMDDSLVRADTTASSLEVEQGGGNINKTQSKAISNEPVSQGTSSGGGPRCQETMWDTISHIRVLDLENTKTTQALEIDSWKRRVKKLEKKKMTRTHKLKRLYKVSLTAMVGSSKDEQSLVDETAKNQGRLNDQDDTAMFDAGKDLQGKDVIVEQEVVVDKETIDEITLAKALKRSKRAKNTTDPLVVVFDSSATYYDSADESLVCSTPLLSLKKLDGADPISGPKTIKSILKSKSTFKAKTLKGITINEPSLAPARGKSSSASKTNSALVDSTLPNHDTIEVPSNESQRNTTDPLVVVFDSSATYYDSADESLVCSTPLLSLKKLDGADPISGPKTIKSILKSKSTFKAKTLKGITINEPSLAPARGKSSSASKTNSTLVGKLKM
nr:retrovirus-related Pol polyprotein from transposon TNT 1-94 [Tanacetum cinerariifolium]